MSEMAFAAGSAVCGVPVVVDAGRVRLAETAGRRIFTDPQAMARDVAQAAEWDRFESGADSARPGCGCSGGPCRPCRPLDVVSDGAGRVVLEREKR